MHKEYYLKLSQDAQDKYMFYKEEAESAIIPSWITKNSRRAAEK